MLRKTKAAFGQFTAEFEQVVRRMAVDAQINFRVDEFQFFGHFHNQVGQIVNGGAAVFGFAAAEHQALAVVALLNAAVQIGVLVQRNEKFGKEFRGGFASQPAGFQVFS